MIQCKQSQENFRNWDVFSAHFLIMAFILPVSISVQDMTFTLTKKIPTIKTTSKPSSTIMVNSQPAFTHTHGIQTSKYDNVTHTSKPNLGDL